MKTGFLRALTCFVACCSASAAAGLSPIGWKFDRDGHGAVVFPESHFETKTESSPIRIAAIEKYVDRFINIAVEDYPLATMDLFGRCLDEELPITKSLAIDQHFERWVRSTGFSVRDIEIFHYSGGDFAKYDQLISLFSLLALESKAPNASHSIRFRASPLMRLISDKRRQAGDTKVRELETYGERLEQWCSAARSSRERAIALEFAIAAAWIDSSLSPDDLTRSDFVRMASDSFERMFGWLLGCSISTSPCELVSAQDIDLPAALSRLDMERADVLLGQRNSNMMRRAMEYMRDGPLFLITGAAHLPTFQVRGAPVYGMIDLFRQNGFRATPLYLCGDTLCEGPASSEVRHR